MKKNTEKNREMLSAEIVEQMDLDIMMEVLRDQHEDFYDGFSDYDFDSVWREVFGED